jgi:hypothetical protein
VVSRRRGDHGVGAVRPVLLERRQRAAPLERAQLVDVLALQIQRAPLRQLGRRLFEWGGKLDDAGDIDGPWITSAS